MTEGYTYQAKKETEQSTVSAIDKYFIWHIQGGLGKNIAATALCRSIKETYADRKLILVVSYPEVFLNNPYIDRVFGIGQAPYFYQDYIQGKDVIISRHEPYNQTEHITKEKHLIENWCNLLGIEYTGQQPEININYPQKMLVGAWQRLKPVMIIQTGGGPMEGQKYGYSWTRDMPIEVAQAIVDKFKNKYHIIQVTRPDGYVLQEVERQDTPLSNIELFALLASSSKRVLIDSCLQHAAAAFSLKSTVLWVGTSSTVFGYKLHNNIQAKVPNTANQLIGSYLFDYQFENNLHECPYIEILDIFNIKDILTSM